MLLAGPTASGKSALALEWARHTNGVVINTDAMQVYRDLEILTARPTPTDRQQAPHRLYGHVDASQHHSVAAWLQQAKAALEEAESKHQKPIFVGGSGLYFKALTQGLADIPPLEEGLREDLESKCEDIPTSTLHEWLTSEDPELAARLKPHDRQRLLRGLLVIRATGQSLLSWQKQQTKPLLDGETCMRVFLNPHRQALYERIERRWHKMVAAGVEAEAEALWQRVNKGDIPPTSPVLRAHGIPWFFRYFAKDMTLDNVAQKTIVDTRRYAKRQWTWFRHQMTDWTTLDVDKNELS